MPLRPKALTPFVHRESRPVGDYRVFRTSEEFIEDARGNSRGSVFVFQCPDWCNTLAVTEDDCVVFVWQHRFGTRQLSLEIPGGMIDPGEAPETAALRELAEEAGYEAPHGATLLTALAPNPALQGNTIYTYLAEGVRLERRAVSRFADGRGEALRQNPDDPLEELEVVLIPVADLPALLDQGQFTHALCVVALETYLRRRRSR